MKKLMLLSVMSILSVNVLTSCENKKEENMDEMNNTATMEETNDEGSAEIENTDVVPSGTYTGMAKEVDPAEKEIYVETPDGKVLELYFTDSTSLTKNGEAVTFDKLTKGGKVEVTVEKKGNRLDPKEVKIMD